MNTPSNIYLGVMSGTSLDGADAVALTVNGSHFEVIGAHSMPFDAHLRAACLALQSAQDNEIHTAQLLSNQLADVYSSAIVSLMNDLSLKPEQVAAVGVHGQTIRHRPEHAYTVQLNQPARIAEQTGLTVVSDFRARDIAAGGHGAPLVPAFHDALWRETNTNRVVVNIGGFANISVLNMGQTTFGFDTGPGNVLMDLWIAAHHALPYDANGGWAAQGTVNERLLADMLADSYFHLPAPKSTGRDYFHMDWLNGKLAGHANISAVDVQATLLALTAHSISDAIKSNSPHCHDIIVAGGGALNRALMLQLQMLSHCPVTNSGTLGIDPMHLEGAAFAWLAFRTMHHLSGNLPAVTGARGERILGQVTFA
ncbi:anhydro-N-acetylmuramic acid kinase [Hydromonas duriensis]|uniref:Anhydro-N-acetylmuramic acid kinase n=1 Tax=Hydromonas duriensis TaxID=1527608 RepID=A0A4R6YA51_9BURK|nr:anhydro-N-acetylmuramic acid kinase [Hydromonas duriensis]TDR32378.1 anhydro-N-acetylmuramic acid kinase [Hydromonas duriensis]